MIIQDSPPAAPLPHANKLSPGTGRVIALLVASAFVVILNETIMSVALPILMVELSISATTAQWLTTGFMLMMAIVIPITGYLLKRFPLRGVYIAAMALFSLGTLIAATASGFEMLLTGRLVQAIGTAVIMPLLMTTVLNVVPTASRGRMMGVISIVIAVAPAIGPTVSGLILSILDWRWMFWIVLPIALLALGLGIVWVRNVTEIAPGARFDVLSVVLSAFGFGGLIYGLSLIGESGSGRSPLVIWIPLVIGVIALTLFVARQLRLQRSEAALLDLRTFQSSTFSIAITLVFVIMAALFGSITLLPIYLQQVLGLSTLTVGLMLLPGGVAMGAIAPIVGSLFDRFGPRPLVIPGMFLAAVALWGMTTFTVDTTIAWVITVHIALNLGLGFVITPLMTSALGSLPRRLYSQGSAIFSTIQQVAGAAGTALFVTLLSVQSAALATGGEDAVHATAGGVHVAFFAGACIATVAIILAFFIHRTAGASEPAIAMH